MDGVINSKVLGETIRCLWERTGTHIHKWQVPVVRQDVTSAWADFELHKCAAGLPVPQSHRPFAADCVVLFNLVLDSLRGVQWVGLWQLPSLLLIDNVLVAIDLAAKNVCNAAGGNLRRQKAWVSQLLNELVCYAAQHI